MIKISKYNLIGQRFGRLVVIKEGEPSFSPSGRKRIRWICDCDCGSKDISILEDNLTQGHTQSCGCLKKERSYQASKKYNKYDLTGEFGIGYTSKGEEFYFDLEDYEKIKDFSWFRQKKGYIATDYNDKRIYMHRYLMLKDLDEDIDVDHIGHVKHDNRKQFLRVCDSSHNMRNSSMYKNNSSGVTGIWWFKDRNKWVAEIRLYNKKKILGYFLDFNDAVEARKEAEEKYFGEWSFDNSIKLYNIDNIEKSQNSSSTQQLLNIKSVKN